VDGNQVEGVASETGTREVGGHKVKSMWARVHAFPRSHLAPFPRWRWCFLGLSLKTGSTSQTLPCGSSRSSLVYRSGVGVRALSAARGAPLTLSPRVFREAGPMVLSGGTDRDPPVPEEHLWAAECSWLTEPMDHPMAPLTQRESKRGQQTL